MNGIGHRIIALLYFLWRHKIWVLLGTLILWQSVPFALHFAAKPGTKVEFSSPLYAYSYVKNLLSNTPQVSSVRQIPSTTNPRFKLEDPPSPLVALPASTNGNSDSLSPQDWAVSDDFEITQGNHPGRIYLLDLYPLELEGVF